MSSDAWKSCLVTGAAGGIGRALARTFSDAGYYVIATDIVQAPDGIVCQHYVSADLERFARDEQYARQVVSEIRKALGGKCLNVLINNAAVQILGGTDKLSRADWKATLNVNVLTPFLLTQALLPDLEAASEHSACVINISSIHARLTKKNFVAYATSKAALSGMTRALAVDLGPRVRINAIEPAAIQTPMLEAGFKENVKQYAQLKNCHPRLSLGQPDEVARLALAIANGELAFLHGSCITLDGGISARLFDPAELGSCGV